MSLPSAELPSAILFCRLCQSLYRHPRTLPCLHSFCEDCLRQVATGRSSQGDLHLACPVCGQTTPLTPAGVSALTANEFLVRMCREYVAEVQKTLVLSKQGALQSGQAPLPPSFQGSFLASGQAPLSPSLQGTFQSGQVSLSPSRQGVYAVTSPRQQTTFDFGLHGQKVLAGTPPRGGSVGEASPASPHYLTPTTSLSPRQHLGSLSASPSEVVTQTARRLSADLASRGGSIQRRLSTASREVVHSWECLQRKLHSLQSAALKVTYSLDTVNMAEAGWHQRKQDLRRDVQRRSAQLQFFIKRQERLLLAALDSRQADEGFLMAADEARNSLRGNLKLLMHEIDVVRSVLDLATEEELLALSSLMIDSTVSQTPVFLTIPELNLVVSDSVPMEDLVGQVFGYLSSTPVTSNIFTPEAIDKGLPIVEFEQDVHEEEAIVTETMATNEDDADVLADGLDDVAFIDDSDEDEVVIVETLEMVDGKMQVVSKTEQVAKPKKKKPDAAPVSKPRSAAQAFDSRGKSSDTTSSTARQTTASSEQTEWSKHRGGQELHGKVGGAAPAKTGTNDISDKSTSDGQHSTLDRFQNIRESLRQRRRDLLVSSSTFSRQFPGHPAAPLASRERRVQSLDRSTSFRADGKSVDSHGSTHGPRVPTVAAPLVHSPEPKPDTNITTASTSSSDSGIKDHGVPTTQAVSSTTAAVPGDGDSRPVRRAISAASDRASKMEYLRESWRKRKELLIQSEAFITQPATTLASTEGQDGGGDEADNVPSDSNNEAPASSVVGVIGKTGGAGGVKQSLKTRLSSLKQALKKNGKSSEHTETSKGGPREVTSGVSDAGGVLNAPPSLDPRAIHEVEQKVLQDVQTILQKRNAGGSLPAKVAPAPPHAAPPLAAPPLTLPPTAPLPALQEVASPISTPTSPSQPSLATTTMMTTTTTVVASKPAMIVRPHPRGELSPPPTSPKSPVGGANLETLLEEESKATPLARPKPGLRITAGNEADKVRLAQVRENVRRKKERWRSLSLT